MTAPLAALAADDEQAGRRLARMKRVATGLLAGAAVVYVVALLLPASPPVGFLRAGAEAAMVGGLADWFAVTALFRHPLGLRVPHTALVPRQKDELATKLGEFVTGNFLTPDAVAQQLREARVVVRLGALLVEEPASRRVAVELARAGSALVGALDAQAVGRVVVELARRDVHRRSYAPVLGGFLELAVQGRGQQALVDVAAERALEVLRADRARIHPQVKAFVERIGWLARLWAGDRQVARLLDEAEQWLVALLAQGPAHPARRSLDRLLERLAADLQADPGTVVRVDARLRALLDDDRTGELVVRVVADVLQSLRQSLDAPDGELEVRLAGLVRGCGRRAQQDAERLELLLERLVRWSVAEYGDQVVLLVRRTVQGWDARDASTRIERAVGRDLQFIRVNGTVVGALAGLAIHVVALLLS